MRYTLLNSNNYYSKYIDCNCNSISTKVLSNRNSNSKDD